jgi:hypothetical protein
LKYINLENNNIRSAIPERLGNLENLDTLRLRKNQIKGIHSTLGNMKSLKYLDLAHNQIAGALSADISKLTLLKNIFLNNNRITDLPDLTSFTTLDSLNLSYNYLTFEDLESNWTIPKIKYSPQSEISLSLQHVVRINNPVRITTNPGGTQNNYQWYHDDKILNQATTNSYLINSVNRATIGYYYSQVTSNIVPGLTLKTGLQRVDAQIKIKGKIQSSLYPKVDKGKVFIYEVTKTFPFPSYDTLELNPNGEYALDSILLRDYMIMGAPNSANFPDLLPTYFGDVIYWDEADVLKFQGDSLNIRVNIGGKPAKTVGSGALQGTLSLPEETEEEGRFLAVGARVSDAGVSLRRKTSTGKTLAGVKYELVAYTKTDADGFFSFENLPSEKLYIKIEFPGVPMDTTTDIAIDVTDGQITLAAEITKTGIAVDIEEPTGLKIRYQFESLTVYPNPAADHIFVKVPGDLMPQSAEIYDLSGILVKRIDRLEYISDNIFRIGLKEMKQGEYILSVGETRGKVKFRGSGRITIMR